MQTIGERLEEARKRKGISIREAAEATKIRGDYLNKFESNQFDIRLPEIYIRGFLRTYAVFLKLSGDKILNDYLALGLGDAKNSRPINREIYGRMDLSVASAEKVPDETRGAPSAAAAAVTPTGEQVSRGDNNPATFRPHAGGSGFPIDPNLVLKGLALVGGVVVLVLLLFWGIGQLNKGKSTTTVAATSQDNTTWVKPQPGERTIGIAAIAPVDLVTLTDSSGAVLYRGPLKTGELRTVPYNQALTLVTETPQNLQVDYKGRWPVKDKTTGILAPKPGT